MFKINKALHEQAFLYASLVLTTTVWFTLLSSPVNRLIKGKVHLKNNSHFLVCITGCDTGFGRDCSKKLKKLGFQVLALCMTEEGARDLLGIGIHCVIGDVTKVQTISSLVAKTNDLIAQNPSLRLWAVINNAGIAPVGYLDWLELDTYRQCMEVNYFAPISVIKSFLPLLKQTCGSRIINLSSMAGLIGTPTFSAYSASKHAIEGLMKSLRPEASIFYCWILFFCF